MKIRKFLTTILILTTICITGCSNNSASSSGEPSVSENAELPTSTNSNSSGENTWNTAKFIPLEFDFHETDITSEDGYVNSWATACNSKLYIFYDYESSVSSQSEFWLYTYDIASNTLGKTQLILPLEGIQEYIIISGDVLDSETLTLKLNITSNTGDAHHIMVETDMAGNVTSIMDPYPEEEAYPWNADYASNLKVFPAETGKYIIRHWDSTAETSILYQFDIETGERTNLGQFEQEYINTLCALDENIYFVSNGYINKYNTQSQTTEALCNILHLGVPQSAITDCTIMLDGNGQLLLCDTTSNMPGIYYLTDKDIVVTEETHIEFANLSQFTIDYTKQHTASFSAQSNTCTINLEQVSETELTDFHDRTIVDIVAGKGPELLWVSEEDMLMLAEKGAIMDIREMIPEDTLEQLFPGVIQAGTVNGKLVGITPEVSYVTLIASDKVWDKDSWTLEDIFALAESKEWEYPFLYSTWGMSCYSLFYDIFAADWSCSPYVDMENGVSHFNDEVFIKTMELCKKYDSQNADLDANDLFELIDNGDSIARICYIFDGIQNFSNYMDSYSDSGHIVGFPTDNGSGNYLYSEGYLVVNANATHTAEIADFITYLLSYENQFEVNSAPVRRDVVENSVVYFDTYEKYMLKKSASEAFYAEIALKEDGSTYLQEYLSFAESCVPRPTRPTDITAILGEEFPAYFTGNKSAEDIANIIHNRVQLYFDEKK